MTFIFSVKKNAQNKQYLKVSFTVPPAAQAQQEKKRICHFWLRCKTHKNSASAAPRPHLRIVKRQAHMYSGSTDCTEKRGAEQSKQLIYELCLSSNPHDFNQPQFTINCVKILSESCLWSGNLNWTWTTHQQQMFQDCYSRWCRLVREWGLHIYCK